MTYFKSIFIIILILSLSGCTSIKQDNLEQLFQTHSAAEVKKDYKQIISYVLLLKKKLDLRNPNAFDNNISNDIYSSINNFEDNIELKYINKPVVGYRNYMQLAFSKNNIENRNDFLIVGLYKNIFDAYDIDESYKITALSYDITKLRNLYHNLEVLSWRLKTSKDIDDDYLFLTWQNNWQIELEKKVKNGLTPTWQDIQNLKYIKSKEESIFGYSNFSFEHLLLQIKNRVRMSLERLGDEPSQMGISSVKSMFIFL